MADWLNAVMCGDVARDDSLPFEAKRDEIVRRLKAGVRVARDHVFLELVNDLAGAPDEDEFDAVLDDLYDWADDGHRLWLDMMA